MRHARCCSLLLAGLTIGVVALFLGHGRASAAPAQEDCEPGGQCICRDETQLRGDLTLTIVLPEDAPRWWADEIEAESAEKRQGFEGRGETGSLVEETENVGGKGCSLANSPPDDRTCEDINRDKAELRAAEEAGTITADQRRELDDLEGFGILIPDDCWGTYPSDRYELTWDSRSATSFDGWGDRLTGWIASMLYGFGKLAIRATLWLVRYAFLFDISEYRETVAAYAGDLDRRLVHFVGHEFSLVTVAWFALMAAAGFFALRGKLGRAASEILMTILLAALATVVLTPMFQAMPEDETSTAAYSTGGYMDSFVDLVEKSSVAPLLAANGRSPNEDLSRSETEDLLRDTQGMLHREFVEAPYWYINWGKDEPHLDDTCREIAGNILTVVNKPSGWPKRYMVRHGCLDEARYNNGLSVARFAATVLVMIVALVVAAAVGMSALTLLMSKFMVAVLFIALPFVVVAALLPGRGRRLAWWWLGSLAQMWLASLAMGGVIMLLLFALQSVRATTSGLALAERWVTILLVVAVIYVLRKRLVAGSQRLAGNVSARLTAITESAQSKVWDKSRQESRPGQHSHAHADYDSADTDPMDRHGDRAARTSAFGVPEPENALGASGRPAGVHAVQTGGVDLTMADEAAKRTVQIAAKVTPRVVGAGVALAGMAAAGVLKPLGKGAAGLYRIRRQRAMENRRQVKGAALRAALNDWEGIRDINRAALGHAIHDGEVDVDDLKGPGETGLFLPGDGGRPSQIPPTPRQISHGTWKFNMRKGVRDIRRGRMAPYGGETVRIQRNTGMWRRGWGAWPKPGKRMRPDGKYYPVNPPKIRKLPKSAFTTRTPHGPKDVGRQNRMDREGWLFDPEAGPRK